MDTDRELNPMNVMKPINLSTKELDKTQPLTSSEIGKLWASYLGNTMSTQILSYFLQHCDDEYIRRLLENGLALTNDFTQKIKEFLNEENFPIPVGFSEDDVNLGAPRLYQDEFYVHYLKYAAKAGMSLYSVALPLTMREDIREFFIYVLNCTTIFLGQINNVLIEKKYIPKLPNIPIPNRVDFVHEQNYLKGFVGEVRTLNAMEIIYLLDNSENNITSKTLLLGFYQTVQDEKIKALFKQGLELTDKAVKRYLEKLHIEQLETPSYKEHLVTT